MFDRILNWVRRSFALVILISLFFPFVTMHTWCGSDYPYTGWEAVAAAPLLALIPGFAASVVVLTFIGQSRVRTAVGRLILALFKALWTGMAVMAALCFLFALPHGDVPSPEVGGCMTSAAWAGIFICDLVESCVRGRQWFRWKRERPMLPVEDPVLTFVGWSLYVTGGIPFMLLAAWEQVALFGMPTTDASTMSLFMVLLNLPLFVLALWWVLACLAGWGLRRGLPWSLALRHVVTGISLVLFLLAAALAFGPVADHVRGLGGMQFTDMGVAATIILLSAWAAWNIGTLAVLLGAQRRLFPSRRVRVQTPDGPVRVSVPRCPACAARFWFDAARSQLVCRPCGTAHTAVIERNEAKAVDLVAGTV